MNKFLKIFLLGIITFLILFYGAYNTFAGTNPFASSFNSSILTRLEVLTNNLEAEKSRIGTTEFSALLNTFDVQLNQIKNRYPNNTIVSNLVGYFNFEINRLRVGGDLEDIVCELTGNCNANTSNVNNIGGNISSNEINSNNTNQINSEAGISRKISSTVSANGILFIRIEKENVNGVEMNVLSFEIKPQDRYKTCVVTLGKYIKKGDPKSDDGSPSPTRITLGLGESLNIDGSWSGKKYFQNGTLYKYLNSYCSVESPEQWTKLEEIIVSDKFIHMDSFLVYNEGVFIDGATSGTTSGTTGGTSEIQKSTEYYVNSHKESFLNAGYNYINFGPLESLHVPGNSSWYTINGDCNNAKELAKAECQNRNRAFSIIKNNKKIDVSRLGNGSFNPNGYNFYDSDVATYSCDSGKIKYTCTVTASLFEFKVTNNSEFLSWDCKNNGSIDNIICDGKIENLNQNKNDIVLCPTTPPFKTSGVTYQSSIWNNKGHCNYLGICSCQYKKISGNGTIILNNGCEAKKIGNDDLPEGTSLQRKIFNESTESIPNGKLINSNIYTCSLSSSTSKYEWLKSVSKKIECNNGYSDFGDNLYGNTKCYDTDKLNNIKNGYKIITGRQLTAYLYFDKYYNISDEYILIQTVFNDANLNNSDYVKKVFSFFQINIGEIKKHYNDPFIDSISDLNIIIELVIKNLNNGETQKGDILSTAYQIYRNR